MYGSSTHTVLPLLSVAAVDVVLRDGSQELTADWDAGPHEIRAETFESDVATGTAPLVVASTTVVANLNASLLEGNAASAFATSGHTHSDYLDKDGSVALTGNWDAGSFRITAETLESDVATGTAPLVVASTTVVANLNASLLEGNAASAFATASHNHAASDINSGTLAHERGGLEADVSAYGGLVLINGGSTSEIKCNFAASAAPTTGDDSGDGYVVGSIWIDTTNDKAYVCLDATSSAAVWTETTQSGGGDLLADGSVALTADWDAGSHEIRAETFQSDVTTGTAPLVVASTTVVANLNASLLEGNAASAFATSGHTHSDYLDKDGSVALTGNWDAGSFEIRAQTFESDVATGTAPLVVASTTVVANLNASLLEGNAASAFVLADGTTTLTADWDAGPHRIRAEILHADVTSGAPLIVGSTTQVANLNASYLEGNAASDFATASHTHAASAINSGTLAHERGGLEADVSAVAEGDIFGGTGTGSVGIISASSAGTDDVPAIQSDGSLAFQEPRLPRGYLYGLKIENDATDSDHDIVVNVGQCRNADDDDNLTLTSSLVKQIDATWAEGDSAGGLFSGTVAADTWYHVFVIKKDSDGTIDAGFDTDVDAGNIPSGWTAYRRIGSVLTDSSSNIEGFIQRGDFFVFDSPITDHNAASVGTSASSLTVSTPTGVKTLFHGLVAAYKAAATPILYCSSLDVADSAPSSTTMETHRALGAGGVGIQSATMLTVWTNTSSQFRARSSETSTDVFVTCHGWIDLREV